MVILNKFNIKDTNKLFLFVISFLLSITLISCGIEEKLADASKDAKEGTTAPSLEVEVQNLYKADAGNQTDSAQSSPKLNNEKAGSTFAASAEDADWENVVKVNNINQENYQATGEKILNAEDVVSDQPEWNVATTYNTAGTIVKYDKGSKHGIFINSYWTQGDEPSFEPNYGPWKILKRIDSNGDTLTKADVIGDWDATTPYSANFVVKYDVDNDGVDEVWKSTGWSQGAAPTKDICASWKRVNQCFFLWERPWKLDAAAASDDSPAITGIKVVGGGKLPIDVLPPKKNDDPDTGLPSGTPVVPPVIVKPTVEPKDPATKPTPITVDSDSGLPSDGYEFLREVSGANWDWLFPLRSGKYVANGGSRNQPPLALADGSKDTFSLVNFKKAVLEYNAFAKANGYKQFLNEGTKTQQAEEFLVFWAKSSRETSGSWSTASSPWIETNQAYGGKIWKGGLYWVEEVGYSTDSQGKSAAINYVDAGSAFIPEPGRSYYGRGIIQLSWNYNYGAFNNWLYDNGLLSDVITSRDILLKRPDYVATNGKLSILSGIWFWMTPQGAKPSSHDVIYGNVYSISQTTKEEGLPQSNNSSFTIPTAAGHTTDQSVFAYRVGSVINIVNGGLECNKAAKWHPGPPQRVSYYNAYTMYFNEQIPGLNATLIDAATNVWDEKVTPDSHDDLQSATCYNQKSYYGW